MANSQEIVISGKGLHSGNPVAVTFRLREDSNGLKLNLGPLGHIPLDLLAFFSRSAKHCTVLSKDDHEVALVEHLFAALLPFTQYPIDVTLQGNELPGLDGSAGIYFDSLCALSQSEIQDSNWQKYASELKQEEFWQNGYLKVTPAENFSVHYIVARGDFQQSAQWSDAEKLSKEMYREILQARTFMFYADFKRVRQEHSLLQGLENDSGLLIAESIQEFMLARQDLPSLSQIEANYPLVHPQNWRMPMETAKHKILDLLGDLAIFAFRLPRLKIEVKNGGHFQHQLLLEKLIHEQTGRLTGPIRKS